jgi:hypothetical protein
MVHLKNEKRKRKKEMIDRSPSPDLPSPFQFEEKKGKKKAY